MPRIAVIGPVASGKSTLARRLGTRLGLPSPTWTTSTGAGSSYSEAEWAEAHRRLLAPERWIVAGDYRAVAGVAPPGPGAEDRVPPLDLAVPGARAAADDRVPARARRERDGVPLRSRREVRDLLARVAG